MGQVNPIRRQEDGGPSPAPALAELDRVIVRKGTVEILRTGDLDAIRIAWSLPAGRRKRDLLAPAGAHQDPRPIKAIARERLIRAIVQARIWVDELVSGAVTSLDEIASREGISERSARMTMNLAFLRPELTAAAVAGTLGRGVGLSTLADAPLDWRLQV